jgi:hypothetical protein
MERFNILQQEIEDVRKKLDDAIVNDYDEDICYRLSVELDKLIEDYITIKEEVFV